MDAGRWLSGSGSIRLGIRFFQGSIITPLAFGLEDWARAWRLGCPPPPGSRATSVFKFMEVGKKSPMLSPSLQEPPTHPRGQPLPSRPGRDLPSHVENPQWGQLYATREVSRAHCAEAEKAKGSLSSRDWGRPRVARPSGPGELMGRKLRGVRPSQKSPGPKTE